MFLHAKGMHRNKLDDWQMSYYDICCRGVLYCFVFQNMWKIQHCLPLIHEKNPSMSWFNLHSSPGAIALIHLATSSPSSSPIYLAPHILAHTPSLRFIPTLQYHLSPIWTHIMLCYSQFPALVSPRSHDINTKKTACVGVVFESMKQQLLLLVEWAKHIPEFCSLPIDDRVRGLNIFTLCFMHCFVSAGWLSICMLKLQLVHVCVQVTLLQTHSAEHLILGAARRSLPYYNLILLGRTD